MSDEVEDKRLLNRSPKHPGVDLAEAITLATRLHEAAGAHAVNVEAAAQILGVTFGSGTSNRVLSSLVQFGLAKSEKVGGGRKIRLTDRGLDIVVDPDGVTPTRGRAVREAALAPPLYQQAWDRWGPRIPDDRVIAPVLIREFGFNPKTTGNFLRDFRATVAFAGLDRLGPGGQVDAQGGAGPDRQDGVRPQGSESPSTGTSERMQADPVGRVRVADYTIPLRGGATAVLSIPVPLSRKNYQKLKGWMMWAEDSLVEDQDADDGPDTGDVPPGD